MPTSARTTANYRTMYTDAVQDIFAWDAGQPLRMLTRCGSLKRLTITR
ncbi:hypothetical protein [uncultured Jatrophihabitans sp.]